MADVYPMDDINNGLLTNLQDMPSIDSTFSNDSVQQSVLDSIFHDSDKWLGLVELDEREVWPSLDLDDLTDLNLQLDPPVASSCTLPRETTVRTTPLAPVATETSSSSPEEALLTPPKVEHKSEKRDWYSWDSLEQHKFFSAIKKKRFTGKTAAKSSTKTWGFDLISKKIGTKSPEQVRQYYYRLIKRINELLKPYDTPIEVAATNDTRIALLCYYRACLSCSKKGNNSERLDHPKNRRKFAGHFHTSFIKTRKQMIAAQGDKDAEVKPVVHEPLVRKKEKVIAVHEPPVRKKATNLETSGLEIPAAVVHQPLVRKKSEKPPPVKRKLMDTEPIFPMTTPDKRISKKQFTPSTMFTPQDKNRARRYGSPAVSDACSSIMGSPASVGGSKPKLRIRFLPMDKYAKQIVSNAGLQSKVELKVPAHKKLVDIWKHMMKKWANAVGSTRSKLRFVPLGHRTHPGWGHNDISITLGDIVRQINTEEEKQNGLISLEYRWDSDENSPPAVKNPLGTPSESARKRRRITPTLVRPDTTNFL